MGSVGVPVPLYPPAFNWLLFSFFPNLQTYIYIILLSVVCFAFCVILLIFNTLSFKSLCFRYLQQYDSFHTLIFGKNCRFFTFFCSFAVLFKC